MQFLMTMLEFVNAGPFEYFKVDLQPGTIGVMGSNGSGKTSFLRLWCALMTGKFDLFPYVKRKVIFDGIEDGQPSYIRGCFYAGHDFYDITRHLDSDSAASQVMRITFADQSTQVIRGSSQIEAHMKKLGLSASMLRSSVFQERPAWVVESTDSGRAELLKALCQTEPCERVIAAIKQALKDSPLTTVSAPSPEDNPQILYTQAEERSAQLASEVAALEKRLLGKDLATRIAKSIKDHAANDVTVERINELREEIPRIEQKLALLNSSVGSLAATVESSKIITTKLAERAQQARAAVEQFDTWQANKSTKDAQLLRVRNLSRITPAVPVPDNIQELRELAARSGEFAAEHERLKKQLNALLTADNCPTCEQALPEPEEFRQNLRVAITDVAKKAAKSAAARVAVAKCDADVAAWDKLEQKRLSDLSNAKSILATLPAIPDDFGDVDDERAHIAKHDAAVKSLNNAETQLRDASGDLRSQRITRDARVKELESLEGKLVNIETFTPAQIKAYNDHLSSQTLLPFKRQALTQARTVASDLEARCAQYLRRVESAAESQKIRTRFEEIIEKLGREHLQKIVVSQFRRKMETALVDGLQRFGSPFPLRLLDNLEMETTDAGGNPRLVKALSTGQRAVAAVVFWRAVASVFGSGVLVLDEPTANMDPANIRFLREAFTAFTAELASDQQLVVITHSEDLRSSFNQIIDFGVKQGDENGSDQV